MRRLGSSEALDHPRRRAIVEVVHRHHGICFRQVAAMTGIATGTVRHHLNVLLRAGLVWDYRLGPQKVLHFPGSRPPEDVATGRALAATLDDLDQRLLAVARSTSLGQGPFFAAFPTMPRATVQHRLERLVRRGFLTSTYQGRYRRYAAVGAVGENYTGGVEGMA